MVHFGKLEIDNYSISNILAIVVVLDLKPWFYSLSRFKFFFLFCFCYVFQLEHLRFFLKHVICFQKHNLQSTFLHNIVNCCL